MARAEYVVEYRKRRKIVLARDGGKCVKCGTAFSLEVHHVNGHAANDLSGLVTLCFLCHGIAPMGEGFAEWLKSGRDGIEVLRESLAETVIDLRSEDLTAILEHLDAYLRGIRRHQLTAARLHKRSRSGRCEGRLPYGTKPGEAERLRLILSLREAGKTGDAIAEELNSRLIPTRSAARWRGNVVRKILARNRPK